MLQRCFVIALLAVALVPAVTGRTWVNPNFYSPYANGNWASYKGLQQVAASHGDTNTHVMLTEYGYSTQSSSPLTFDPVVEAYYLALGFNLMLQDPTVDGIVWTRMAQPTINDFWSDTSLISASGNPLPAYAVYQKFANY